MLGADRELSLALVKRRPDILDLARQLCRIPPPAAHHRREGGEVERPRQTSVVVLLPSEPGGALSGGPELGRVDSLGQIYAQAEELRREQERSRADVASSISSASCSIA